MLFLFDSCFSGTVFKAKSLPDRPPHISRLTAEPVRQFITAGDAGEEVPAFSTFAPAFVDALRYRRGDLNRDGYVTGTELGLHLRAEVPKYAAQTPQFGKIRDYELARGEKVDPVEALLAACNAHLGANRLTTGAGGNAVDCYRQVLEKGPTNLEALRGLEEVSSRYVALAEGAVKEGDNKKAEVYLKRLESVNPEHPQLAAAPFGGKFIGY